MSPTLLALPLLAGAAAGVAALLLSGPATGLPAARPWRDGPTGAAGRRATARRAAAGTAALAGLALSAPGLQDLPVWPEALPRLPWPPGEVAGRSGSGLVLVAVLLVGGVGLLVVARRRERGRERTRRLVVEVTESLAGELRAGLPVDRALDRCVEVWVDLAPVAAAARLGADVPSALDRLAARPGAEGLGRLASAWRVSARSGCSLADVLDQVAASARAAVATAGVVRAELASARATARLVSVLPVATLALASGGSGAPWRFLLLSPAGVACLAAGVVLTLAGLWWIERIAAGVRP